MMGGRLMAMIIKEIWAVLRDSRARITLIVPPIMQLVLFAAAATLEVNNVVIGVLDRDNGAWSAEFINQLAGSPNVKRIVKLNSLAEVRAQIDNQRVIGAIVFDDQFSRKIAAKQTATVQMIFDGRRSNTAQLVASYAQSIAGNVDVVVNPVAPSAGRTLISNWFNPNLDFLWFVMPSLVVVIAGISGLTVTSQSVARERELGTFDQLMVSPLRLHEILIGKMVPPFLIGTFSGTIYLIVIPLFYGVPFTGSILLYYIAFSIFLIACIGIGMMVSAISHTQQQSFLGAFVAILPLTLLSGFAAPIDNMPWWLQYVSMALPNRHFLVISEGLFLKHMPAIEVFANIVPMIVIAVIALTTATLLFRSRVE